MWPRRGAIEGLSDSLRRPLSTLSEGPPQVQRMQCSSSGVGTWSAAPLLANAICLQTGGSTVHQATTLLHSQSHSFNHLGWLENPESWGDCSKAHRPSAHSSLQSLRGSGGPGCTPFSCTFTISTAQWYPASLPGAHPVLGLCSQKHLGPRPHSIVGMSRLLSLSLCTCSASSCGCECVWEHGETQQAPRLTLEWE